MTLLSRSAALFLACLPLAPAVASESDYVARHGFNFAVLAEVPGRTADEAVAARVLAQIGNEADLVLHVGDLKGPGERCDDAVFERRRKLLDGSPVPLVYTPGDLDWAECDQEAAGGFGPVERLSRLRELFFESTATLGQLRLDLQSQSSTVRYRGYPENARWEYGNVMFATLNMPGNANNFLSGAGRNGEYEDRLQANAYWLRHAFASATKEKTKALVLAFNADPHFEGSRSDLQAAGGRDPYGDFKNTLARLASKYPGEVLLVHADDTTGESPRRPDHPVKLAGKVLDNVTRIRAAGAPMAQSWIKVEVPAGGKTRFKIEERYVVLLPPQP